MRQVARSAAREREDGQMISRRELSALFGMGMGAASALASPSPAGAGRTTSTGAVGDGRGGFCGE